MHAQLDRADEPDDHGGERDVEEGEPARVALLERLEVLDLDRHADRLAHLGPRLFQYLRHLGAGRPGHVQLHALVPHPQDREDLLLLDALLGGGVGVVRVQLEGGVQGLLHAVDEGLAVRGVRRADHGGRDVPGGRVGHRVRVRAREEAGGDGEDEDQHGGGQERRLLERAPSLGRGGRPSVGAVRMGEVTVLIRHKATLKHLSRTFPWWSAHRARGPPGTAGRVRRKRPVGTARYGRAGAPQTPGSPPGPVPAAIRSPPYSRR